jgi:YVTN family beta-propeller protein
MLADQRKFVLTIRLLLFVPLFLSAQWLETTIFVPDSLCGIIRPRVLTYNPTDNKIYVGGEEGGCLIVIDGETDEKIAKIPAGMYIASLCYNPTSNKIYCANGDSNNITVIDAVTNNVITTIPVGNAPRAFAWNPVQNRTYVANYDGSSVSVVRDSLTGIEELIQYTSLFFLDIYPNPTKTLFTIYASTALSNVTIYDILGNVVLTETITKRENTTAISVKNLSAGVYFVKLDIEGTKLISKVIVTK